MAGTIKCTDFKEVRVRLNKVRHDQVAPHYAIDGVPVDGYYVLRLWLQGRHVGRPKDFIIGIMDKGTGEHGDLPAWKVPDTDQRTEYRYNLDLEVFKDEDAYRKGESLGGCNRGGDIVLEPAPSDAGGTHDAPCDRHASTITGSGCYERRGGHEVAVTAEVEAENFVGEAAIMSLTAAGIRHAVTPIQAPCGTTTKKKLSWTGEVYDPESDLHLVVIDVEEQPALQKRIRVC